MLPDFSLWVLIIKPIPGNWLRFPRSDLLNFSQFSTGSCLWSMSTKQASDCLPPNFLACGICTTGQNSWTDKKGWKEVEKGLLLLNDDPTIGNCRYLLSGKKTQTNKNKPQTSFCCQYLLIHIKNESQSSIIIPSHTEDLLLILKIDLFH